ncbi:extracellular calcium-sensing receptor-like isoform X2 [Tigriopus californicus]|uniref:extracellular calcium-sensing receptor-like isoform X2 n=1 Tax=Tigriopus californicus TaxID=6832 RepID=UPI0027DAAC5D|nr:extracellular calcium-sensing receptor-like isoform X2 [Tigriopus californicus]|eukprot:TCALIF_10117-PA protein Name:"Similar to GRM3 Metabotropic glutamate receptor 3 (Pongo abelii)" AED:0.03 eAED:0.04 QI:0/1/0.5/1/0.66/0.75/4/147/478
MTETFESEPDHVLDPLSFQSQDSTSSNFITKMNTEFFALPGLPPLDHKIQDSGGSVTVNENTRGPRQMCPDWGSTKCFEDLVTNRTLNEGGESWGSYGGILFRDSWMIPMLTFSAINVIVILTFEVYVLCKASRNTPSRRHLFLGQMLLLGLLIGSLVGFAYAVEPTDLTCAAIRLGTGFSYTLIYSSLLVKLVFLISLNTGVYLPATYQALLFLFCILVQVVIGLQWISSSGPLCSFTTQDHLLSLLYVVFLIIFSSTLAVKSRTFRDNYREAKYIGGLMVVTVPIWLAWVISAVVLHESYHPAIVGFGILAVCAITFVIMFLPKSRQLSAIGKEGIYIEDQEDRFSIHSDRYSPSFYHFKPHKTILSPSSLFKEPRAESPYFRAGNSYTGFHRPLRVVPPSASPSQQAQITPPSSSHVGNTHQPALPPPPYTTRTSYFPSHFFPEKMNHYWQYYYPRAPGIYYPVYPSQYRPRTHS